MNKQTNFLKGALAELERVYQKLRAIRAWRQLKAQEASRQPYCDLKFYNNDSQEISNLLSNFMRSFFGNSGVSNTGIGFSSAILLRYSSGGIRKRLLFFT